MKAMNSRTVSWLFASIPIALVATSLLAIAFHMFIFPLRIVDLLFGDVVDYLKTLFGL
jgi:hypothetical protein